MSARIPVVTVRAMSDPQSLLRVVNVFSQREIAPLSLTCRRADPWLTIDIELTPEDARLAERVLDRLREMVCVDRADLECRS